MWLFKSWICIEVFFTSPILEVNLQFLFQNPHNKILVKLYPRGLKGKVSCDLWALFFPSNGSFGVQSTKNIPTSGNYSIPQIIPLQGIIRTIIFKNESYTMEDYSALYSKLRNIGWVFSKNLSMMNYSAMWKIIPQCIATIGKCI